MVGEFSAVVKRTEGLVFVVPSIGVFVQPAKTSPQLFAGSGAVGSLVTLLPSYTCVVGAPTVYSVLLTFHVTECF